MGSPKEVTLPSGKVLSITLAPFEDAKELQQALLEEVKTLSVDPTGNMADLYKDLFCAGFSSKKVEKALMKCMNRVTYDGVRIDKDTWEPEEARGDYMPTCVEVGKANILPFLKSLYAEYSHLLGAMIESSQKSTTTEKTSS